MRSLPIRNTAIILFGIARELEILDDQTIRFQLGGGASVMVDRTLLRDNTLEPAVTVAVRASLVGLRPLGIGSFRGEYQAQRIIQPSDDQWRMIWKKLYPAQRGRQRRRVDEYAILLGEISQLSPSESIGHRERQFDFYRSATVRYSQTANKTCPLINRHVVAAEVTLTRVEPIDVTAMYPHYESFRIAQFTDEEARNVEGILHEVHRLHIR